MDFPKTENKRKIFILDDESLNIQLLKKILGIKSNEFFGFTSCNTALSFLENEEVDLILLDLVMPEESGLEVLKKIHKIPIQNGIPVIFISANRDVENISESFRLGAVDYINKPFQAGEVVARVENHLKIHKLEKERLLHIQEIEASNKKIKSLLDKVKFEIDLAAKTQKFLLPVDFELKGKYSLKSFYLPFAQVGGDSIFYKIQKDHIDIFFGDISGHGLSAALMSGMVLLCFKMASDQNLSPDQSLYYMHNLLSPIIKSHHLSGIFFRYYPDNMEIEYSYAGHHEIFCISNEKIFPLSGNGTFLILMEEPIFTNYKGKLKNGDRILFYSDGVIENFNESDEILGTDNFLNIIKFNIRVPDSIFLKKVIDDVLHFSSNTPNDDMTMLLFSVG
jgi:sigma-B regulation protein RsbU (phosphoserine phosphatase)